jgi:hypothetical protein
MASDPKRTFGSSTCAICGKALKKGEARRCESCRKVVCLDCFDLKMGVCKRCLEKYRDESSPNYIA